MAYCDGTRGGAFQVYFGALQVYFIDGTRGGAFQVYFGALQVYFIEGALFHSTKCFLIGIFTLFIFNTI